MYHVSFDIDFKRNQYPGKFIVVEGIDGSGKTTQVKLLAEALKKNGHKVFVDKNPTDGKTGKFIRQVLSGKETFSPVAFQYLFCADRAEQQEKILQHLKKREIVLLDRYFWSSVAYGGVDKDIDFSRPGNQAIYTAAFSLLSPYHQFILPDFTFYLDIPAKIALNRLVSSRQSMDIYDKKSKLEKIDNGYKWLIGKFPKEFIIIDGKKKEGEVTEEILKSIK